MTEENLTKTERLALVNQYRILALLKPEEREFYEKLAHVFEWGYVIEYHQAFQGFSDEMSVEETKEVRDTLDMYSSMQRAFKDFSAEQRDGIDEKDISFPGWDGNNESSKACYAEFLRKDGKWEWLKTSGSDGFNSHLPDFGQYERMLSVWRGTKDRVVLTPDEVKKILAVFPHPDSPDGQRNRFRVA